MTRSRDTRKETSELRARYRGLPQVSEEMQAWSGMLADELRTWPEVRERPMFGLVAFYRGASVFAALPKTRGVNSPNSFIFKLAAGSPERRSRVEAEARIDTSGNPLWLPFELSAETDMRGALAWLRTAYEEAKDKHAKAASKTRSAKKTRSR